VERNTQTLAEAERQLEQARRILAHPINLYPDEWMLVATLVGEADLITQSAGIEGAELRNLLQEVVADFRQVTNNFTDPAFIRSTRAARRRNRELFTPG
jgi:hypothetical protein